MTLRSATKTLLALLFVTVTVTGAGVSGAQVPTSTAPPPPSSTAPPQCTLVISPDPVPVGAVVTATASGIEPGLSVTFEYTAGSYDGYPYRPKTLPETSADGTGGATVSFVPDPPVLARDVFLVTVRVSGGAMCSAATTTQPPATATSVASEAVESEPAFTG